jgi:hypothetical protein
MPEVLDPLAPVSPDAAAQVRSVSREPAFLLAAALYLLTSAALLVSAWLLCGRRFIYPLDDAYINMAVAKNFALHGVWGVSPYEFNSTTSSPLYVLLLAGVYRVSGVNDYSPLVLSGLFGLGAVYLAAAILREFLRTTVQVVVLSAFVLLTPLFVLGTLGMEHAFHLFALLLFLAVYRAQSRPLWQLCAVTMLMCAARYEGLLMAGVAVCVLLARREWRRTAVIAVSAWVPVGCYAWFSIAHGGRWLPNSVLLKGISTGSGSFVERLSVLAAATAENLGKAPHTVMMSAAMLILASCFWRRQAKLADWLALVGGAGVLHLLTASVGWVFRYESYLVGAGIVVLACAWPKVGETARPWRATAQVLLAFALCILLLRSGLAALRLPEYSQAIYRQQWQMARFLKQYYSGGSVAANDIGLINYQVDLHCLDLAGLASSEVFSAKREGRDTTEFLEGLARSRHVEVVMLYESWFGEGSEIKFGGPDLPDNWDRVSRWTLPERNQLGDKTVAFFGTDPRQDERLRRQLTAFEPSLPAIVKVEK